MEAKVPLTIFDSSAFINSIIQYKTANDWNRKFLEGIMFPLDLVVASASFYL